MSYSTNECPRAKTATEAIRNYCGLILPMNVRELKHDVQLSRRDSCLILPMNVRELKLRSYPLSFLRVLFYQ